MLTNKRKHEPIVSHRTPDQAWQEVTIDLFGPMPDNKYVLPVLDKLSRLPAAKLVPNISTKPVILKHTEQTIGPPFNSRAFANYSQINGIEHVKTYPYDPQANPAKTFMRPLGEALKAAYATREIITQPLMKC